MKVLISAQNSEKIAAKKMLNEFFEEKIDLVELEENDDLTGLMMDINKQVGPKIAYISSKEKDDFLKSIARIFSIPVMSEKDMEASLKIKRLAKR